MEEVALGRHHGGGIMGEASWRRHHGGGIHLRFSPPVKVMLAGSDLYKHCQSPIRLKVNVFTFSFSFCLSGVWAALCKSHG